MTKFKNWPNEARCLMQDSVQVRFSTRWVGYINYSTNECSNVIDRSKTRRERKKYRSSAQAGYAMWFTIKSKP